MSDVIDLSAGTFLLPHGYYVLGYVKEGSFAKAFTPWVQANAESITILDNLDLKESRVASLKVDKDSAYPIAGPLMYLATVETAKDAAKVYLESTDHDTAQYAAQLETTSAEAHDAMAAAITTAKLADLTAKNEVQDLHEQAADGGSFWSKIPMPLKFAAGAGALWAGFEVIRSVTK